MLDFNYQNTAKIIFGLDSINKLENELKENNVKNLFLALFSCFYFFISKKGRKLAP